jgi:hypothetical protein
MTRRGNLLSFSHLPLAACLAGLGISSLQAATWSPSPTMLDAVRHVESTDGMLTVGDNGKSLGEYQMSEGAWLDVTTWRKARSLPTFDYEKEVWNRQISRSYARDYLRILHGQLRKCLHRQPTPSEVYAAYNRGLTSFARSHYKVRKADESAPERKLQVRMAMSGE